MRLSHLLRRAVEQLSKHLMLDFVMQLQWCWQQEAAIKGSNLKLEVFPETEQQ